MTNYPVDAKRAAAARRYPSRVGGLRATARRLLRKAIGPLLGPVQRARQTQLAALPTPPGRVVFLGDSITENGLWSEWFPEFGVINRGVGGETAKQVHDRLDKAINDPTAVFLLIGTNDIASALPTNEIIANVVDILNCIEAKKAGTPVIVQSVMPRSIGYRDEVRYVNTLLQQLVHQAGEQVTYLDLWPALATPEGALRPDFTEDKLHLNGDGYLAWVALLTPIVQKWAR